MSIEQAEDSRGRETLLVGLSSVSTVGLSAVTTFIVARWCGPEVRGTLAIGTLWLVLVHAIGLRGSHTVASRVLLGGGRTPDTLSPLVYRARRRALLDSSAVALFVFGGLVLFDRLDPLEGLILGSASSSIAMVHLHTALLQTATSLRPFAVYRTTALALPQIGQIPPILFGQRGSVALSTGFLVGALVGHPVARLLAGPDTPVRSVRGCGTGPKHTTREEWAITLASLLSVVAARIDLLVLTILASRTEVGQYSLGAAVTALSTAIAYPGAVAAFRRGASGVPWGPADRKDGALGVAAGIVTALAAFLLFPPLLGDPFQEATHLAIVLCLGSSVANLGWTVTERWRGAGRADTALGADAVGALGTAALTIAFYGLGGLLAVAWGSVAAALLRLLWIARVARRNNDRSRPAPGADGFLLGG